MRVQDVSIEDIIIGERRRDDYGNVQELADSINARGLLHPVTVVKEGDKFKLVAGGRRVRAFQLLELTEIPAKVYSELSEDELRQIELEENLQRLDLTSLERSKNIVALADVAAKVIETKDNEFPAKSAEKSETQKGRPEKAVSKEKVAERIGVPRSTVRAAEQHVKAVESHPELKDAPQKTAIEQAKKLDKPVSISTARKPLNKPSGKSTGGSNNLARELRDLVYQIKIKGAVSHLARGLNQNEQFALLNTLDFCHAEIGSWRDELSDSLNDARAEAS